MTPSKNTTPGNSKVVRALELIESGADTIRGACAATGANRSTVRHHLRARGWSSKLPKKAPGAKAKPKTKALAIQHHLVESADGQKSLTVFIPGEAPVIVAGDHPQFERILAEAGESKPNSDRLRELADTTVAIARHMVPLSERISVADGNVYVDGDQLDTSLTAQIIRVLETEGDSSSGLTALVSFLEKLLQNPSEFAREQLHDWLRSRPFTITTDGDLIAYKGVDVSEVGAEHDYESCWNGPAFVNDVEYNPDEGEGVPQSVGDVVTLPRSAVDPNKYKDCSEGLHVGTHSFASSYGHQMLTVVVNPRDVVGIPTHVRQAEKIRVCRYFIWSDAGNSEPCDGPVVKLN